MDNAAQVIAAFEARRPIALQKAIEWFCSADLEVCGVICAHLGRSEFLDLIQPQFKQEELDDLVVKYLLRCLVEDQESEWIHSKYESAWALADWFNSVIDNSKYSSKIAALVEHLRDLYLAHQELRTVLLNGLLEHIYSSPTARKFFSHWQDDPLLKSALDEAGLWRKKGGRSPIDPTGRRG